MNCKKWIANLIFLISTIVLATGSPISNDHPDTKISNGWITDTKQAPYHVSMLENTISPKTCKPGYSRCSANIIQNQWLLTAGHCLINIFKELKPVYLAMGVDDIEDHENMPRKNNIFPQRLPQFDLQRCHPNFQYIGVKPEIKVLGVALHDVCLLRVDHKMLFGPYINRVAFSWNTYDQNIQNKEFMVSGYCLTGNINISSFKLLDLEKVEVATK